VESVKSVKFLLVSQKGGYFPSVSAPFFPDSHVKTVQKLLFSMPLRRLVRIGRRETALFCTFRKKDGNFQFLTESVKVPRKQGLFDPEKREQT